MTKLSVNINKIATLRNARGGDLPNVLKAAVDCQAFGADGITVHPRPDQRHITKKDAYELRGVITTEYNIEGYPSKDFIKMVLDICPEQVTLVPDAVDVITSNCGWDTLKHTSFLKEIISEFKESGIRTSIFVNPEVKIIEAAKLCGTDRIELYTEDYAARFPVDKNQAISPYLAAAEKALECELEINAGHDLSLNNLSFFINQINNVSEVSIGHSLISDAIYLGLENTVQMYKRLL
ncbi:pyridoxine 5'-phosphate synthase [Flavobacteriales bacterium]|nr:pyridoxine 5'-phosphate synthase [Flavobacteriales bacterium]